MDAHGDFVITWSSHDQDGSGWGVYAQRYDASGNPQGGEFLVNTTTQGDQEYSSVTMDAGGNFLVAWQSHGQDGDGWGIFAQQYDPAGQAQGREFQVNTTTAGDQQYASIAMNGRGNAVAVWSGNGIGDASGVFAQRFQTGGFGLGALTASDALSIQEEEGGHSDDPGAATADPGPPGATGVGSEQVASPSGGAQSQGPDQASAPSPLAADGRPAPVAPPGVPGQPQAGLLDPQVLSRLGALANQTLVVAAPMASRHAPEAAPTSAAPVPVSAAVTGPLPGRTAARSPEAPLATSGTPDATGSLRDEGPRQPDESQGLPLGPAGPSAPPAVPSALGVEVTSAIRAAPLTPEQRCDAFFADAVWMADGSGATPLARPDAGDDRPQALDAGAVVALGLVAGAWNAPGGELDARKRRGEGSSPLSLRPDA
jgi:hypothetical protein